jgi:hypothetical protein
MDIRTNLNPLGLWNAIDNNTYDGAEDAGARAHCRGEGTTEAEAIVDLKAQLAEYDEATR